MRILDGFPLTDSLFPEEEKTTANEENIFCISNISNMVLNTNTDTNAIAYSPKITQY